MAPMRSMSRASTSAASLPSEGGDSGNNLTLSNNTFVGGTVSITNGKGALDIVSVNAVHIGGNLIVNQGAGADNSLLDVFGTSFIGGYLSATGGAANDQ